MYNKITPERLAVILMVGFVALVVLAIGTAIFAPHPMPVPEPPPSTVPPDAPALNLCVEIKGKDRCATFKAFLGQEEDKP